jgi:hypothetical protein
LLKCIVIKVPSILGQVHDIEFQTWQRCDDGLVHIFIKHAIAKKGWTPAA